MKPIVEGIGLDWGGQHKKVAANESRWGISVMEIPSAGGAQSATCIMLRKLPGWLATIDPGRIKNPEVRARVIQYQNECDDVLCQYWNEGIAINPRAANSAIDYDRISPAQAQDLKEIVAAIVKEGVQGYGETWGRLQRKFRINSYLELPATRHLEARNYLIAKLPRPYMEGGEVVEAEPTPTLRGRRWLIATDHEGKETVQPVGAEDFICNWPRLVKDITSGDCLLSNAELLALNHASSQRLMQRLRVQAA